MSFILFPIILIFSPNFVVDLGTFLSNIIHDDSNSKQYELYVTIPIVTSLSLVPSVPIAFLINWSLKKSHLINKVDNYYTKKTIIKIPDTRFFNFIKEHLKIILLICLPLYGILINYVVIDQYALLTNPIAVFIFAMLNMPFFYDPSMYKHEWIIHPILDVASNLMFWVPTALLINRAYQKRKPKR